MSEAKSLLEPGWRETTKRIDGLSLHIVEAGRPGDPLVILVHGFPEFWWAWRKQITPLASAGYHVVVPDMRGYNESDAPQEISAYALDVLAADVVGIADAYGAARFHLVGHDWGAVIGWWVAARYPARLNRVVLMDGPHPDIWARQALRHPTQALRSTYVAFFQLPWVPEAALKSFDFAGLRTMMQGSAKPGTERRLPCGNGCEGPGESRDLRRRRRAKPSATDELSRPDLLQTGKRLIGIMGGGGQSPAFHLTLVHLQCEDCFPLATLVRAYRQAGRAKTG